MYGFIFTDRNNRHHEIGVVTGYFFGHCGGLQAYLVHQSLSRLTIGRIRKKHSKQLFAHTLKFCSSGKRLFNIAISKWTISEQFIAVQSVHDVGVLEQRRQPHLSVRTVKSLPPPLTLFLPDEGCLPVF